jgi:hypothetical protein
MRSILEEETAVELQHINVKLLLEGPEDLGLDAVVNVFHSWIQEQVCEELLLDVADYRHVHHGPGIVLIGHEADYSIDNTGGKLGVRYNRKAPVDGTNVDRLRQATRSALTAAARLEEDTRLNGKHHFNGRDIEIFINDRLLTPNSPEMRTTLEPDFGRFLDSLFPQVSYTLSFEPSRRRLLGASIRTGQPLTVSNLTANLKAYEQSGHGIV